MNNKKIRDIIIIIRESYKNNLYLLSTRLLTDIVKEDLKYYKLYILFAYLMQLEDDEDKLKISIQYFSKAINSNKHYLLAYCYRYKTCKKLLEMYKSKNTEYTKELEQLMKLDIEYLKNVSNNFIIKKHIKNFIKNPLSYYDKEKLILKTSSQIKKYIKYFNKEKVKYDYIDIMENYNFFINRSNDDYEAYPEAGAETAVCKFPKHKGMRYIDIYEKDPDYLHWLYDNLDLDEYTKKIIEELFSNNE